MIKHGIPPHLECSSRGDKRFSAFFARIQKRNGRTIEELYQGHKIINGITGHTWKEAKGKMADNQEECNRFYSILWDEYIKENPHLLEILKKAVGLSDTFGQANHCCQATELWRIRNAQSN